MAMSKRERHGLTHTPEHRIWSDLRNRCNNPLNHAYSDYGGRGIKVDPRWDRFTAFLADMGPRPSPKHSIDRIDCNGPYSPENCRWATRLEQANNKRNNTRLTMGEKTQTIAMWARDTGLSEDVIEMRLRVCKWGIERALTTPHRGWGPRRPRSSSPAEECRL